MQPSTHTDVVADDDEARALRAREILSGLDDISLPAHAECELAETFSIAWALDLKFCGAWAKWLCWDGIRWRIDRTKLPWDLARKVCVASAKLLQKAKDGEREKLAAIVGSSSAVAAVLRLAGPDRRHAITPEQLDVDGRLVTTPAGVIDFHIGGRLRAHKREDYMTKCTSVAPDHDADDSVWQRFLDEVTCGRRDLQDYLQRLFGLCLVADTRTHVLPFFLGSGANAKSTLLELMLFVFGDYGRQLPSEVLMEARGEVHPTAFATLMGVRLAVASEVDEGRAWAEARIKSLTGDEKISARFMRGDYFEFSRTHTLLVAGNHKPMLRSVDDAIRRRVHLVPFDAQFVGEQADRDMPTKLRAQAPAVLAWVVRGALEYLADGLRPPQAVLDATQEYFTSQDTLGEWIAQACDVTDGTAETTSSVLYASFHRWKEGRGEHAPSQVRFSAQMEQRFRKERRCGLVRFCGIRLRVDAKPEPKQEG